MEFVRSLYKLHIKMYEMYDETLCYGTIMHRSPLLTYRGRHLIKNYTWSSPLIKWKIHMRIYFPIENDITNYCKIAADNVIAVFFGS